MILTITSLVELVVFLLLIIIPLLIVEYILAKNGIVKNRSMPLIVSVIVLGVIKYLWLSDMSWLIFAVLLLVLTPLGIHRGDFWSYFQNGKYWWK